MRVIRLALARLTGMFTKDRADADLRAEFEAHLDMEIDRYVRRGMAPDEARRQALLASGGLVQGAEAMRDQRGLPWLESVGADIAYGFRALRRNAAFTTVVVVTLALGIGANTAIFSVVRGVLLKPLPNRDGDRLVYLRHSLDGAAGKDLDFSVPEVRDFRTGVPSFVGVAEYSPWSVVHTAGEGAVRWQVGLVTGNYFDVMGLAPVLGRLTLPSDDGPSATPVAVLAYESWMKRFGGDPAIVGKQLTLDDRSVTVIGVLQPAPFFPERVDALLNMVNSSHHVGAQMVEVRSHRMTQAVARLAPQATVARARSEVATVYARMQKQYAAAYDAAANYRVAVVPFREVLGERASVTLWLLMGAAALVLIIAVANVANLTLMRGIRREHELVIRSALGAGMARLRRLLLVENLMLAFLGASLGVALAIGGVKLLTLFAARYSPRANEIALDSVVLGFTLAVSAAVALLLSFVGWIPTEGRFGALMAAGGRRVSGSMRKRRLQRGLVVMQFAVSVILLAGAGLLMRTLSRLSAVDTGLSAENVVTMQLTLLARDVARSNPAAVQAARLRIEEIRREIAALPGVSEVGVGGTLPLRKSGVVNEVKAENRPVTPDEALPRADQRSADPSYFSAAGIRLIKGRLFTTTDKTDGHRVIIINQALADRLFPNEDPLGRRIAWTGPVIRLLYKEAEDQWWTIVGVVGNTRDGALDADPQPVAFMPQSQYTVVGAGLVIRGANPSRLVPAATRIVRRIAPTALVEEAMTLQQFKAQSVSPRRLNTLLLSVFGGLALVLAAVGIAGVLSFSVSARTNEIGIRMSLGADRGAVERMILGEGGRLVALGLALGVAGALAASGVIRGLLFAVAPNDPLTFTAAALVMAAVGIAACWIPALRAARVDPVITMRAQ